MPDPRPVDQRRQVLDDLARRHVWWWEDGGPGDDAIVAQVMTLGTCEDIRRTEVGMNPDEQREVMLRVPAG